MRSLTNVIIKNSKRTDKATVNVLSILAFLIVFGFLGGIMTFASFRVTKSLIDLNQSYAFINILLLVNFFVLFEKSIYDSLNVLYFSKDLKILLRMPLKPKDILSAKIINMIISEWPAEIIMLAIPMVVYGILTKCGMLFYLYMIIELIILPIIPIMVMSLIIGIIMRFTNKIKNKSKVVYITIICTVLLFGVFGVGFNVQDEFSVSNFQNILLKTNGLAEMISNNFVLIKPIINSLVNYNSIVGLKSILIYILESIAFYYISIQIISKIYLKGAIGTTINGDKKIRKVKELTLKDFKTKNTSIAYIIKEFKTMIITPIFCIQCLIMPVTYPLVILWIANIFAKFADNAGMDLIEGLAKISTSSLGIAIFLSVGQVFYMMNFSSIIAVSRESNNWILAKYIPLNMYKQFNLKIVIGSFLNFISSVVVVIIYYYITRNISFSIILFLCLALLNLICEKLKLILDYKNPKLTWDSEYTMMKQNTNVMYSLFYTLAISGILYIISKILANGMIYVVFILLSLFIIYMVINRNIRKAL